MIDKVKIIIGVIAGKGGVGKSTVTVSLARTYAAEGYKVGILDGDIYGPSIRKMLPEDILPAQEGEKIVPAVASSIKVISKTFLRGGDEAAVVRAPIANGLLLKFIHDVCWDDLDILLIDFPPGTGDIQLTLLQEGRLTGVIIVTTPQEVAKIDVEKSMQMVSMIGVPLLGVIENMSFYEMSPQKKVYPFGKGGGRSLASIWDIPLLGEIPLDPHICETLDRGEPIKEKRIVSIFNEIAEKVLEQIRLKIIPLGIKRMDLKDNNTLFIEWSDERSSEIRLNKLQMHCSCAKCAEAKPSPKYDVEAKKIITLGNYALRIEFTSGCSKGIYSFSLLRKL